MPLGLLLTVAFSVSLVAVASWIDHGCPPPRGAARLRRFRRRLAG